VRSTVAASEVHHESAGQGRLRRSTEIEGEQEERRTRAMGEGEARNGGGVTLADTRTRWDGGISRAHPKHSRQASSHPASRGK